MGDAERSDPTAGLSSGFVMRLWIFYLLGSCACVSWAQGHLNTGNRYLDLVDAPVFDSDCQTRLAGAAYLAQVYVGATSESLLPVFQPQPFRTGSGAGYISSLGGGIAGHAEGTAVWAQMRAWEAGAGDSYEAAVAAGGQHGVSNVIRVVLASTTQPGAPLVGLQSFCLVPEPSAGALWALGGSLWWLAGKCRERSTAARHRAMDGQKPPGLAGRRRNSSSDDSACSR